MFWREKQLGSIYTKWIKEILANLQPLGENVRDLKTPNTLHCTVTPSILFLFFLNFLFT